MKAPGKQPKPPSQPDPFSKGYKHRYGEPVSDACGDGKHGECTQDLTKCHCTFRTGHKVMHAYMNPVAESPSQARTQPPRSGKGWIDCHTSPPQADLDANRMREPEGERIRAELVDWMTRNKIVSVLLDTENHNVCIDIAKLPPEIKPVLTHWGSIFVENPGGGYTPPPPRTESISQATKEEWARRIAEMTDEASLHQRFNYQEYIDAVVALMTNKGEKIKTASPRP